MKAASWILCCFAAAIPLRAESVNVAAASDLNFAVQEIIKSFEQNTGNTVRLTLGSSGNFYAQILNGAPFDVFLSADMEYPKQLEKQGYAVPGSTFAYGAGRIALWVPNRSSLDLDKVGMNALLDNSIRKIAIANPAHAPYGRAAVAALEHAKLYDRVKNKLVLGENISQAAQFVQSGAADLGVIAISIALSRQMGDMEVRNGNEFEAFIAEVFHHFFKSGEALPIDRERTIVLLVIDVEVNHISGNFAFTEFGCDLPYL